MGFGKLSLTGRALRYLSAREHSRAELERKLRPYEESSGELARVLDALEAKDFINPARVVESVINSRSRRMGQARIRQELQAKGISPELAAPALQALKSTEYSRALGLWQRRYGGPPADAASRARQQRFLLGRGFAHDLVHRLLSGRPLEADMDVKEDGADPQGASSGSA